MDILQEPRCSIRRCKHFRGMRQSADESEASERLTCAAFPDGIPAEIAYGTAPHVKPFPGDRGIQYERAADADWPLPLNEDSEAGGDVDPETGESIEKAAFSRFVETGEGLIVEHADGQPAKNPRLISRRRVRREN